MALVCPDVGESVVLSCLVNKSAPQDLKLKLYKSNTTLGETTTSASLAECDFSGYAAVTLTGTSWTVTTGAPTSATYAEQIFTANAGSQNQNVYGWYLVQSTSGTLVAAETFTGGPFLVNNSGDQIKVTPTITCD
jgi:hypothetical protein